MTEAIIYAGGINHPFDTAAPALAALLGDVGFAPHVHFDAAAATSALECAPDALFVVYALRWSMTQHEKYAPHRAEWAFATPPVMRAAIRAHVERGGALLAVHTASICFDDWPEWQEILGGGWTWGTSHHPPLGPVRARPLDGAPLTDGLHAFELVDEVYAQLAIAPRSTVIAHAEALAPPADAPVDGVQPIAWLHEYGRGRVAYDALGHDAASLNEPTHRRLLQRAALWCCRRSAFDHEAA